MGHGKLFRKFILRHTSKSTSF